MSSLLPSHHATRLMLTRPPEFEGVLTLPRREQTPEGQLFRFHFGNGYGALVIQRTRQPEMEYELCLTDCTREPVRPTFEHLICPEVLFGLSQARVSELLGQAERLPRHARLSHVDAALLKEDF